MATLCIKGMRVGEGRPKTIVPIMDASDDGLLRSARRAIDAGADCLEWRADYLANARDPHALARAARALGSQLGSTPLIATLRTASQGGLLDVDDDAYAELVRALMNCGADNLIDIEHTRGDELARTLVLEAHRAGLHAIVSYHDFASTPPTQAMVDKLCELRACGADIPKLAVMAHTPADAARLMEATATAAELVDAPLLTIAMGPHGAITRLAGESFGSALTFCALEAASAPGQVGLAHARCALDALHAALAPGDDGGSRA